VLCLAIAVVDILTTAGNNLAARSAKLSGADRASTLEALIIKVINKAVNLRGSQLLIERVTLNSPINY
jgi:hypothetical protein